MGDRDVTTDSSGALTTHARVGAALEGAGYSSKDIQTVLHVASSTVARWRRREDYREAVAEYRESHVEVVEALINMSRIEILQSGMEARSALREMLTANNSDGKPYWQIRLEAARILYSTAFAKMMVFDNTDGDSHSGPQTAIINVIHPGSEKETEQAVATVRGRIKK